MPHRPKSRTLALLRFLRAVGPLPRRRKKLPRQQHPDIVIMEYYKAILPFLEASKAHMRNVRGEILRGLAQENATRQADEEALAALSRVFTARHGAVLQDARMDASPGKARALALVNTAAERAADAFDPRAVRDVARKFGHRTSEWQRKELDKQIRSAVAVPLSALEKPAVDKLEGFAALNVDLIKTVPERYFDRIREDVLEAYEDGDSPEELAARLAELDDMEDVDVMRIARDQIGKLNAEFNQERQEALGITGYIWRTMNDNRVRDEHADLEGEHFEWDDPPDAGTDGEPAHPGEAIQCRCYAEPDVEQLLEGLASYGGDE